jgi:hypothetical protein
MNREEVIELAREAGMALLLEEHAGEYGNGTLENTPYPELERFAELVAAAEREACAKVCDGWPDYDVQGLAEAIRARGEE